MLNASTLISVQAIIMSVYVTVHGKRVHKGLHNVLR